MALSRFGGAGGALPFLEDILLLGLLESFEMSSGGGGGRSGLGERRCLWLGRGCGLHGTDSLRWLFGSCLIGFVCCMESSLVVSVVIGKTAFLVPPVSKLSFRQLLGFRSFAGLPVDSVVTPAEMGCC